MYYKIGEKIEEFTPDAFDNIPFQYVAVIGSAEWIDSYRKFDMGIEWDIDIDGITNTRAEVNFDSLTGTFSIPSRKDISGRRHKFAFTLDEKGVVFIDDGGFASRVIEKIAKTKKYINPCLERFLYDFLESIIHRDYQVIEAFDSELDAMEADILGGVAEDNPEFSAVYMSISESPIWTAASFWMPRRRSASSAISGAEFIVLNLRYMTPR
jgi:magnesium transporter